jgi:hypothetical protein
VWRRCGWYWEVGNELYGNNHYTGRPVAAPRSAHEAAYHRGRREPVPGGGIEPTARFRTLLAGLSANSYGIVRDR